MHTSNRHPSDRTSVSNQISRASVVSRSALSHWIRGAALAVTLLVAGTNPVHAASGDSRSGRDAFLRAIAEVETGNNPRKVGRQGERGLYQFRQITWRQHTSQPFRDAHNPSVSYAVASRHYDWIMQQLERSGRPATPYMIAAAWNSGVTRVTSGRIPATSRDYAQRVVNLASCWSPAIRAASITGTAVSVASN